MTEKIQEDPFEEDILIKIDGIKDVISSIGMLLVEMDFDGNIVNLNDFASDSLGYPHGELRGKNWFDVFYPDDKAVKIREFKEKVSNMNNIAFQESENEIVCGDSAKRIFHWKILIIKGNDNVKRVISFGEDVTKNRLSEKIFRKLSERKPLQALESILPILREYFHFERVSIGLADTEISSFRIISQYALKEDEESFRTMMKEVYGNSDVGKIKIMKGDFIDRILKTGQIEYIPEFSKSSFRKDDVRARYGWHSRLVIPIVFSEKLKIFLVFASRKTNPLNENDLNFIERIKPSLASSIETWYFEEELRRLNRIDLLTGVFNRQSAIEAIKQEISLAKRNDAIFSVSMIDLDRFKKFNDTYGHDAGDTVLKGFSKLIRTHLREYDVFGRYGGDEFVIVFPETPAKTAVKVLQRLAEIVSLAEIFPGERVEFSAGVAEFKTTDDESTMLKRADTALYKSKKDGKIKAVFVD